MDKQKNATDRVRDVLIRIPLTAHRAYFTSRRRRPSGKWTKAHKTETKIMVMNLVFVARNNSAIRHSTQMENNQPKFM